MYTIRIEQVGSQDGQPYASVSFTRDTGEVEQYRELIEVTPEVAEVPEVIDEETGEVTTPGVPYAPAVMGYTDFMTRLKLEVVHKNFTFSSESELNAKILAEKNTLEAIVAATAGITVGEYVPVEPEPSPEPENPVGSPVIPRVPTPEEVFVTTVKRLQNALAMAAVGTLKGTPPNALNEAYIAQGLQYVQDTATNHPEYLDLVDLSALLPLLKP